MKLHEGDKNRFLRPMFDAYNSLGDITYDDLLQWVNTVGQNKFTYDWLSKDKESLYNDIVNDYKTYKDAGGRRSERKADVITYTESKGLKFLAENEKYIFFWVPSYKAAVWCDSFDCAGFGGKWCIGWRENDTYWRSYTDKGDYFILMLNKKPRNAQDGKAMIELAPVSDKPQIWFQTDRPNETLVWTRWKNTIGFSYPELKKLVKRAMGGEDLKESVTTWDELLEGAVRRDKSGILEAMKKNQVKSEFVKELNGENKCVIPF